MSGETSSLNTTTYIAPDTKPTTFVCGLLVLPDDPNIKAAVNDALSHLGLAGTWIPSSGVTDEDMQMLMNEMHYELTWGDCP